MKDFYVLLFIVAFLFTGTMLLSLMENGGSSGEIMATTGGFFVMAVCWSKVGKKD